jgi:hypothetical protein
MSPHLTNEGTPNQEKLLYNGKESLSKLELEVCDL